MRKILTLTLLLISFNSYSNDFNYVWNKIVELEGKKIDKSIGYSHSKFGITKGTLNSYNKKFKKNYKLNSLTEQQAKTIAYKMVYEPNLIAFIKDDRIAMAVMDWVYNSNPINATKQIQSMLGLKVDGKFSIEDIKYINSLTWEKFISKYYTNRKAYFYRLNKPKFIKGWLARLEKVRKL